MAGGVARSRSSPSNHASATLPTPDAVKLLKPDNAAAIAKLSAPAPDLRNRAALTLKDNKARFRAIREGHPGSGMLPDTTLSDQDITDVLAYLALLRQSQAIPGKNPY